MTRYQLALPLGDTVLVDEVRALEATDPYDTLVALLDGDLDFHGRDSGYASHNFHSFPAKFPPQLPRVFIEGLTQPGDIVLDPMMGSGTTIVEAYLTGRQGVGFDIDPLAVTISKVKVTPFESSQAVMAGKEVVSRAANALQERRAQLEERIGQRWNGKTRRFVDYWFAPETQIELQALVQEIDAVSDPALKTFLQLVFSSIIITKTGGVSLAFDLAHTRPHRAKVVVAQDGRILVGEELADDPSPRTKLLTKTLRSPLEEFEKRLERNLSGLQTLGLGGIPPIVQPGDAQQMPLPDNSVDLIVTSPPYASNAIDYMRAHKFSLVWFGYPIDDLGQKRKEYIGGEAVMDVQFEQLPPVAATTVQEIANLDPKKGRVLHRYYSEMTRTLREMYRVLRPGRTAAVVVGSSIMRGRDTRTDQCLADIGKVIGFEVPRIGVRNLDRNRRMMPAGMKLDLESQIQQRMHEEYVIGFYKPLAPGRGS
jgi:DNA modification methylase